MRQETTFNLSEDSTPQGRFHFYDWSVKPTPIRKERIGSAWRKMFGADHNTQVVPVGNGVSVEPEVVPLDEVLEELHLGGQNVPGCNHNESFRVYFESSQVRGHLSWSIDYLSTIATATCQGSIPKRTSIESM